MASPRRHVRTQVLYARLKCTDDYVDAVDMDAFRNVIGGRNFRHAAIIRGVNVPEVWVPVRDPGLGRIREFVRLRTEVLGGPLSAQEIRDIRFTFQMVNGVINNRILNRPEPMMLQTDEFEVAMPLSFMALAGLLVV